MADATGQAIGERSGRETACPGCGVILPVADTPAHAYIGASAACWTLYGEVLARAYGDAAYRDLLQLIVDTYAVQHPGTPGRRAAQSVALHLMTLCLMLEEGADPRDGPRLHKRMIERTSPRWLEPPAQWGALTIADIAAARDRAERDRLVRSWSREVWRAWAEHHATVREWLARGLG